MARAQKTARKKQATITFTALHEHAAHLIEPHSATLPALRRRAMEKAMALQRLAVEGATSWRRIGESGDWVQPPPSMASQAGSPDCGDVRRGSALPVKA